MKRFVLSCLAAASVIVGMAPASATELVVNGDFSTYKGASRQASSDDGSAQYLPGWTSYGYNFIVQGKDGITDGAMTNNGGGSVYFWSTNAKGASNGFTLSDSIKGSGGNYFASDGAYQTGPVYQQIDNLVVGQKYDLSFNWAAAQQHGFTGDTTESWTAFFGYGNDSSGYQTFTTNTVSNPSQGFTPWQTATTTFTATGTSQILGFLAAGSPQGVPPFSLLDDVSLQVHKTAAPAVPEASTWAMMLVGFGAMGASMRRRRGAGPRLA